MNDKLQMLEEHFKNIYFHAGRYSAGARDEAATRGWKSYCVFEGLDE
jgi:hypothetical protein